MKGKMRIAKGGRKLSDGGMRDQLERGGFGE